MITIKWQVEQLSCYPQVDNYVDVVFSVSWRANGTDGTHNATAYGEYAISPYDGSKPFIAFKDLTEEQVISWVQDLMGSEQVATINENIKKQIAEQINPPVVRPPLPWVNN